jgi:hypothetical protein
MKLKELLLERFVENDLLQHMINPSDQFRKLKLESLKEELLKCDEFLGCEGIDFMEFPTQIIDNSTYIAQTMKLGDDTKFVGTPYIYNISFTPEMYDPNSIHTTVKDGAAITPTLYNPITFEPTKKIVLHFNPEGLMGETSGETKKQEIRDLLEKVLQNPEEYQIKGERGIMVRGVFKTKELGTEKPPFFVGTELNPDHSIIFYFEKGVKDGETTMTMKQKQIPNSLKEEFIKRFTNGGAIATATTEEIDEFIKENTK